MCCAVPLSLVRSEIGFTSIEGPPSGRAACCVLPALSNLGSVQGLIKPSKSLSTSADECCEAHKVWTRPSLQVPTPPFSSRENFGALATTKAMYQQQSEVPRRVGNSAGPAKNLPLEGWQGGCPRAPRFSLAAAAVIEHWLPVL